MKASLFAVAALAAVGLSAPANAAPLSVAKDLATALAETVHFNHRSCQLGRYGWHLHARGNRLECRPFRRVIRRFY
jgi:hypothetical protein